MTCQHERLSFTSRFIVKSGHRLLDASGHCADCGAPILFEPKPTLTIDDKNLQIPFRMGAPDQAALVPSLIPVPVVLGGPKRPVN